ncbi:MAG: aminoacyl-tRNA hydrolase [Phycisphaeraceae bacterium]|nr:aminoacyl-tRNA hydrolase [Phycisphaeraceae bacterium]
MKLIVGLGNPGPRYEKTRHNAGFMAIDRLVARLAPGETPRGRFEGALVETRVSPTGGGGWGKPDPAPAPSEPIRCALLKPATFMNLSGRSVVQAVAFYKVNPAADLLVITDDVALPLGRIRIKPSGGAGGHNGLSDITRALGGDKYARCRVGVGATPEFMDQADWVLSKFTGEEMGTLDTTLGRVVEAVETFIRSGIDAAMNRANVDPDAPVRPKNPKPAEPEAEQRGTRH